MQSGEQKGGGNVMTELSFLRNYTTWLTVKQSKYFNDYI